MAQLTSKKTRFGRNKRAPIISQHVCQVKNESKLGGASDYRVDMINDIGAVVDVRYKNLYRAYYKPAVHIHG